MSASFGGFRPAAFRLLKDLAANNHREWYHENKAALRTEVRDPFASMLEAASDRLRRNRLPMSGSRKTMFRMNRDTRFSNDKSPYKTNVGGLLTPTGRKIDAGALAYAHLDPAGSFVAAGFYRLPPRALMPIRDAILEDPKGFRAIVRDLGKHGLELSREDSLKSMPRGYAEVRDHEMADFIKLGSLIVVRDVAQKKWRDGSVLDELVDLTKAATPLLIFGREAT